MPQSNGTTVRKFMVNLDVMNDRNIATNNVVIHFIRYGNEASASLSRFSEVNHATMCGARNVNFH